MCPALPLPHLPYPCPRQADKAQADLERARQEAAHIAAERDQVARDAADARAAASAAEEEAAAARREQASRLARLSDELQRAQAAVVDAQDDAAKQREVCVTVNERRGNGERESKTWESIHARYHCGGREGREREAGGGK